MLSIGRDRFFDAMDDDFNTGAAVGFLFEMRRCVNHFISEHKLDAGGIRDEAALAALTDGMTLLKELAKLLGVFQRPRDQVGGDDAFLASLMQLIIDVRAMARQNKNFDIADHIRDGLTELGVVLEDRPEGTSWRRG